MNTAVAEQKSAAQQPPAEPPIAKFRAQLEQRLATFAEALPPHITVQRFKSVITQAVTADPGLLAADRVSLFEACLAAANDGLLPDKKQAALVVYNTKIKEDGKEFWIKKVQYMPMIRGIFDKLYNTGQVKSAKVAIVYGGDRFRTWTDDSGDHIEYEEGDEQDRDFIRSAFALVVMKDGGVFVETMKPADIEKIRSKSKAANSGPWVDWWEEMAKKSVFRRLAKRLPMARDLDAVTSRDDVFDQFVEDHQLVEHQRRAPLPPRPPSAMLGAPVSRPVPMTVGPAETEETVRETVDPETGEVTEAKPKAAPKKAKAETKAEAEGGDGFSSKTGSVAADAKSQATNVAEKANMDTAAAVFPDAPAASSQGPVAVDPAGEGGSDGPSSAAADLRGDVIGRFLRVATDRTLGIRERLQEIDLLLPNYEDGLLPDEFLRACVKLAAKVAQNEMSAADAKAKLEAEAK